MRHFEISALRVYVDSCLVRPGFGRVRREIIPRFGVRDLRARRAEGNSEDGRNKLDREVGREVELVCWWLFSKERELARSKRERREKELFCAVHELIRKSGRFYHVCALLLASFTVKSIYFIRS